MEPDMPHHRPHFHAYYQNDTAVYGIDPIEILGGELPVSQKRLVEAWAELHQDELKENWKRLQAGQYPHKNSSITLKEVKNETCHLSSH